MDPSYVRLAVPLHSNRLCISIICCCGGGGVHRVYSIFVDPTAGRRYANRTVDPIKLDQIYGRLVTMLAAAGYTHTSFSAAPRIGDPSDLLFSNKQNVDPSRLDPIYVRLITMLVAAGYIHTSFSAATRIGDPSEFFSKSDVDPGKLDPFMFD